MLWAGMELPACSPGDQIVTHAAYTLKYDEDYEQAAWVAYRLTPDMLLPGCRRSDDFRPDPCVGTESALPGDYRKSGFDKGHLAPAADMAFSCRAMQESFYMSNMSPQRPSFNRGIWKELEELVREWARHGEGLYVVTGPVLKNGDYQVIGKNRVAVPELFFKVVLDNRECCRKAIAFVLPNRRSEMPIQYFAMSVNAAEDLTGIDFFPALDDDVEEQAESCLDLGRWEFPVRPVVQVPGLPSRSAADVAAVHTGCRYWLNTKSGARHNASCSQFMHTRHGRCCRPDEGKPCGKCGG